MSITYESIVLLRAADAGEAMKILDEQGDAAALEYLKRWHEPGEGTLISSRSNPWDEGDHLFEQDDFVLYCNRAKPYIGLVYRVPDERR